MYTLTTKGYFLTEKSASATAENKVFTNEAESKFFVPVDYYGKKNTKVK